MAIDSATFLSDIVLFLRDLLRANVTDPLSRSGGVGFVMTTYPKRDIVYPVVVLRQSNITTENMGMQSEVIDLSINLEIQVFARNAKECDEISQDIIDTLRTAKFGTGGTVEESIFGLRLTSAIPIIELVGENTIHRKVMTFLYKAILEG